MYQLPPLPYAVNTLEPYLDEKTVDIHYHNHHKGYLDRLNAILNRLGYQYQYPLEQLIHHLDEFPISDRDDILYHAGGVLNHNLYWVSMTPKETVLHDPLKHKIEEQYGSVKAWQDEFKKTASYVVGSGWTFLVVTPDKKLEIINTPNQETPYLYGLIPILGLDLWEHAYYLKYQYRRADYVDAFFQRIDYDALNKRYEEAIKEEL